MDTSGSVYVGERKNGRMEGKGKYTFANGNYYEGEFRDGMFHGRGIMYVVSLGTFEAEWEYGKVKKGSYTFKDGLAYKAVDWTYCNGTTDRRFFVEHAHGVPPVGAEVGSKH